MGTTMITIKTQIPTPMMILIRMSFHLRDPKLVRSRNGKGKNETYHICFRTRLAPRRNPWADIARLSMRWKGFQGHSRMLRLCDDGVSAVPSSDAESVEVAADPLPCIPPKRQRCLPVLSCNESKRSPRSVTLLMFSRMTPTVSSIWACN